MKSIFTHLIPLFCVGVAIGACNKDPKRDCRNPYKGQTSIQWGGHTYQLVEIGCLCWFAENLRYEADIPRLVDQQDWNDYNEARQPGWCFYNNDPSNDTLYGKLYNWYAVHTGKLCPKGWRVPDSDEWEELADHLGGMFEAGGKMKTLTEWEAPNTDASNSSGFNGLPAGRRTSQGFYLKGRKGEWWASYQTGEFRGTVRGLSHDDGGLSWATFGKSTGLSCRCIKDY